MTDQSKIRLVHQGGRLEGLARPLTLQPLGGKPSQLLINEWQQVSGGVAISRTNRQEKASHVTFGGGGRRRGSVWAIPL